MVWSGAEQTAVQQHLAALEASPLFANADRLAKFLRYSVEAELSGEANRLNQMAIAIDVFERGADFDPAVDSIVRVEAGRLRGKLREYYDTEGSNARIRIALPKGSYAPSIRMDDMSTDVVDHTTAVPESPQPKALPNGKRTIAFAVIGMLVLAFGYLAYQGQSDQQALQSTQELQDIAPAQAVLVTDAPAEQPSIAVLPFVNMSADPEQEYFSDGIAEEILNALAQLPGLRVAARTSSFYFKGEKVDLQSIAEKLNVDHVLEGSVRKAGNRLRITAKLIETNDGFQLWSESYDRELTDIFTVQEEIAHSVVENLKLELGLAESDKLLQRGTSNIHAYNSYLRGRYLLVRGNYEQAIAAFRQTIALGPEFAAGYGGLALTLAESAVFTPYQAISAELPVAYTQALALDDDQVEALLAKAHDRMHGYYDWEAARELYQRALSTGRDEAFVTAWYALHFLLPQRRFKEALSLAKHTERLDPLAPLSKFTVGVIHTYQGRPEAAIVKFNEMFELGIPDPTAIWELSRNYIRLSRFADAEQALTQLEAVTGPDNALLLYMQGLWLLQQGRRDEAEANYKRMIALHHENPDMSVYGYHIGSLAIQLGQLDEGFDWFEQAYDERHFFLIYAPMQHFNNETVWNHPRFQAVLAKMNLDDASITALKAAESR